MMKVQKYNTHWTLNQKTCSLRVIENDNLIQNVIERSGLLIILARYDDGSGQEKGTPCVKKKVTKWITTKNIEIILHYIIFKKWPLVFIIYFLVLKKRERIFSIFFHRCFFFSFEKKGRKVEEQEITHISRATALVTKSV